MPSKSKIELSDDSPAAKAAGAWSIALEKCRFNSSIKYKQVITTIDFQKKNAILELKSVVTARLLFTRLDARILRECTSRVLRKPVQFESVELSGKTLVITLKF